MDSDTILSEQNSKKGCRHRKKHLYSSILQQMEFYFSTSNLSKDRYLSQLIADDPYVDLKIFLNFNKIKKLTENVEDIQKALGKSDLVQLSEDKSKVRRKVPLKVKDNVDECTIYVENIKSDTDHDWVISVFSEFGNVVYVSIPKYKQSRANKGFAFVEFETEAEAQSALDYFESIGGKMPAPINPGDLKSIATFEGGDIKSEVANTNDKKRRLSEEEEEDSGPDKKVRKYEEVESELSAEDAENKKKRKLKKEHKKKNYLKEIGLQILSKKEWKKMRNKYLDLQKKKMKEFKQYLHRSKFSQRTACSDKCWRRAETAENAPPDEPVKLEYKPGLIVKLKLSEPCEDMKKLKNEIKSASADIKYVDVPVSMAGQEVFVRFGEEKSAADFCRTDTLGEKSLLEGAEETQYWEKINSDRSVKFSKCAKKQRGRDKLLKKAAKEVAKHIRFEEAESVNS